MNLVQKYPDLLTTSDDYLSTEHLVYITKPDPIFEYTGYYLLSVDLETSTNNSLFKTDKKQWEKPAYVRPCLIYLGDFFFYKPFSYFIRKKRAKSKLRVAPSIKDLTKTRYINHVDKALQKVRDNRSNLHLDLVNNYNFKISILKAINDTKGLKVIKLNQVPTSSLLTYKVHISDKNLNVFEFSVCISTPSIKLKIKECVSSYLDLKNNFVY